MYSITLVALLDGGVSRSMTWVQRPRISSSSLSVAEGGKGRTAQPPAEPSKAVPNESTKTAA